MDDEMSCGDIMWMEKDGTRTEGEAGPMMNRKLSQLPTQFIDQTAAQPPLSMDSHVGYLFVTMTKSDATQSMSELPLYLMISSK